MKDALALMIAAYTGAAVNLFPRVAKHLGVQLPLSNIEWACLDVQEVGQTSDGIKFRKHGYGVEMDDGIRRVDLDLGDKGQINGFDAWRLFLFAEENGISMPFNSYADVETALKQALDRGEVVRPADGLYYLNMLH